MPGSTQTMVSEGGNNLTTVIVQTVCAAIERKDTDYGPLTGLLRVEEAKSIKWTSNPGVIIELLLHSMGCDFLTDGKTLWRRSTPDVKLKFAPRQIHGGLLPHERPHSRHSPRSI
jgi:hypothetical protein